MRQGWTRRGMLWKGVLTGTGLMLGGRMAQGAPGRQGDTGQPGGDVPGGTAKAAAEAKHLLLGAAVNMHQLRGDATYRRVLAEQYSMVVGENCMKWAELRPTPDTYSFEEADELVQFAEQHGMKVRGHNLCWHEQLPAWFAATATKDNAAKLLTEHIATVAGRYRGRIHSWDVVNEAVWIKDGRGDGMRSSSPWFELLGPGYVDLAFRAARAADPGALLTYNDYGMEYDEPEEQQKRAAVLALVRRLREAKTPIDAVGIQSHIKTGDITNLGDGIRDFAGKMRRLGLQVFLTELDVNDDGLPEEPVEQQDRDVAAVYRHYLDAMLKEPAVRAMLTWGVADEQSWLQGERWRSKHPERGQRPLPFLVDEEGAYRAKPAYFAMRDAIEGAKAR